MSDTHSSDRANGPRTQNPGNVPSPTQEQASPADSNNGNGDNKDERQSRDGADQGGPPGKQTAVVRYGLMLQTGEFRHNLDSPPWPGSKVVARTERGVELGEVVAPVCDEDCGRCITSAKLRSFLDRSGSDYPFRRNGRILRLANQQDIIDFRHLDTSASEAAAYCREQIRQLKLDMKLVKVEHLLGGERIIFYFSSEGRVDFRELVRRLAGQYRTRIEMRQVGARDEARLVADYERCGQQCCCQSFLKDLKPVSMRMAKTQKATLDPSKISGRCGRLMCCLRYEDAGYDELRKKLPRKNTYVRTETLVGKVIDTQILTQLVRLALPDGTQAAVGNEDIIKRNVQPSAELDGIGKVPPSKRSEPSPSRKPQPESQEKAGRGQGPSENKDQHKDEKQSGGKKKRRTRRKRRKGSGKSASRSGGSSGGQSSSKSRNKRRRRGKSKKPSGGSSGGARKS